LSLKIQLLLVTLSRFATALLTLIGLRIATHFLPPEQYGVLALLLAVQMFFALIIINPVGQHITLNTHTWWGDRTLLPRLKSYQNFILMISLLGGVSAIFIAPGDELNRTFISFLAVSLFILASTWNNTLLFTLNMLNFRTEMAIWSVLSVLASVVFGSCMLFWEPTATFWMLGQSIGLLLGFIGARTALIRRAEPATTLVKKYLLLDKKTLLTYCFPVAIANGFMWLQLNGYRFEIEYYWGLAQLGYLAIGVQVATQIGFLAESLATQFLYPMFYKRCNNPQNTNEIATAVSDLMNTLAPIYFILIGAIIAGAPYLLSIMVSANYREAYVFLQVGALIELCRIIGNLLGVTPHIMRQTKYLAVPYILGATCTIVLIGGAGSLKLPLIDAILALAVGSLVMLTGMGIKVLRQIDVTFDWLRWSCGFTGMCSLPFVFKFVTVADGLFQSLGALLLIGLLAGIFCASLLYKNPATYRLISVKI